MKKPFNLAWFFELKSLNSFSTFPDHGGACHLISSTAICAFLAQVKSKNTTVLSIHISLRGATL